MLDGSLVKSVELLEPTFSKNAEYIQEARRILAEIQVDPRSVHAAFGRSIDVSSLDPEISAAGIRSFGVALDLAQRMGARFIIMHSSSEPIQDAERAARMKQARQSIAMIAQMADRVGCRVAVELLPRTCLGRSKEELCELLGDTDPATAGVCLDTNHLMGDFASLPEVVRHFGARLFAVHCSDYDGIDEKHWPPFRGVVDWAAFLAALRSVNFSGPLLYEAKLDGDTPLERLSFLEENFRQLLQKVQRA